MKKLLKMMNNTFENQEYDIEAAIIFNIINFPAYRKQIFEQCSSVEFSQTAQPVFEQLEKAYFDDIIDTMSFKTKFLNDWSEKLKEGQGKCWPEVKTDFFDRAMRRKGQWETQILQQMFQDPTIPVNEIQERTKLIFELVHDARVYKQPIKSIKHVMAETVNQLQRIMNDDFELIKWGIDLLDLECQTEAQDLNIIAARPGIGKTVVAHNCLIGASNHHPVGYWCGEMSNPVIGMRLLSILTGILHSEIRQPKKLSKQQLQMLFEAVEQASKRNIYVSTNVGDTVEDIGLWAKQLVEYHGVKHLFIDYIQRIKPTNPKVFRRDQVQHMSNSLKNLAAELNITITALAQLNRESVGEKPKISHLAECSHLEQDASTIILIDRIEQGEQMGKRNYKYRVPGSNRLENCTLEDLKNTMIMIISKSRHAQRRTLYFDCDLSTFTIHGQKKFTGDFAKRNGQTK